MIENEKNNFRTLVDKEEERKIEVNGRKKKHD